MTGALVDAALTLASRLCGGQPDRSDWRSSCDRAQTNELGEPSDTKRCGCQAERPFFDRRAAGVRAVHTMGLARRFPARLDHCGLDHRRRDDYAPSRHQAENGGIGILKPTVTGRAMIEVLARRHAKLGAIPNDFVRAAAYDLGRRDFRGSALRGGDSSVVRGDADRPSRGTPDLIRGARVLKCPGDCGARSPSGPELRGDRAGRDPAPVVSGGHRPGWGAVCASAGP